MKPYTGGKAAGHPLLMKKRWWYGAFYYDDMCLDGVPIDVALLRGLPALCLTVSMKPPYVICAPVDFMLVVSTSGVDDGRHLDACYLYHVSIRSHQNFDLGCWACCDNTWCLGVWRKCWMAENNLRDISIINFALCMYINTISVLRPLALSVGPTFLHCPSHRKHARHVVNRFSAVCRS